MRKLLEILGIGVVLFVTLSAFGVLVDPDRNNPARPVNAPNQVAPPAASPHIFSISPKGQEAYVRQGPGTSYPVVMTLVSDQSAEVIGRNVSGDWLQIQAGWVNAIMVREVGNNGQVPVVDTAADAAVPASADTVASAVEPAN